jgi:hypothetical protein
MATAIVTDRRTTFTTADSLTGWSSAVVAGAGGATALRTSDPDPVELTGCIGVVVSTGTVALWFTGGSINMSAGTLVYVWVLANGIMDNTTNGGIQIMLGDGTNRIGFHLAGSDRAGFRHSGASVNWQCLVLDTANLPTTRTVVAGTFAALNLGAITQIGAVFKTLAKSVGGTQNCFVDTIRYGNNGIQVTGGTSGDPLTLKNIVTQDESSTSGKAFGIIREISDRIYGMQGPITIGDLTGSAPTYFKDTNAVAVFENRNALPDKYKLQIVGTATSTTQFFLGDEVVGAEESDKNGINGVTIQVASGAFASFLVTGSFVQSSSIYGSSLVGFTEGVQFSTIEPSGSNYKVYGTTFRSCGQVVPGLSEFRNNLITAYTGSNGGMLYPSGANIQYCSFTQNTSSISDPAAIEHPVSGTFTYTGMTFANNEYDIYNSSGGLVTINAAAGSNPVTSRNSVGSSTVINNSVTHTVVGLETGSKVVWIRVSDDAELENQDESGGSAAYTYNYAGDVDVDVQILSLTSLNKLIRVTLTDSDAILPASQADDRTYFNPA